MSFYYEHDGLSHAVQMIELKQKAEAGDVNRQFQYGRFLVYEAEGGRIRGQAVTLRTLILKA